ncbi:hypothetical protein, partial [Streptomyces sp. NPDC050704]|uniref:hypothetical protein n=1 Tax=Streptomyces sp. NPDC050704 TaxID=3157219 RepID=UPI00342579AC
MILVARLKCDAGSGRGHKRDMESNTVTTALAPPPPRRRPGFAAVRWLTTTDHKTIGTLYLVTS